MIIELMIVVSGYNDKNNLIILLICEKSIKLS